MSLWFPRLASDRILRAQPTEAPFAVTHHEKNSERLYCVNSFARQQGLVEGMGLCDAKVLCPELRTQAADLLADQRFLQMLLRWSNRYCPWVGADGADGLMLDVTGSTHLFGGEAEMLFDLHERLAQFGLTVFSGLAATKGAAWAVSHYSKGVVAEGGLKAALSSMPVQALRLDEATCITLQRLGLRSIGDVLATPRATLGRRFGLELLRHVDQAFGDQAEQINPQAPEVYYAVRLTFPDPIGFFDDVMAGLKRLLEHLCLKLKKHEQGMRSLRLTCQRVDQVSAQAELRLARPMHDSARILPLFERSVGEIDAGYGIDQLRLEAFDLEPLPLQQVEVSTTPKPSGDALNDLITRLGSRIGLDKIVRFLPADSHVPERSFVVAPAAYCEAEGEWREGLVRPLRLFAPEPVLGKDKMPPKTFCWRGMRLALGRATGPERIAPEWWLDDPNWRSGLRDYWRVETRQGRRLWMFFTPQSPAWFVQGEFA
ncbi:Y-family DNA polymerase [Pseudovibrio axinellae]|uniref:Y-family DNA polymerase n=1 Tax=Pseudovibrio axinellae TaxID=989403 RepID=UPI001FCBFE70|nr:DNA polymerase Y family protein [Pseudovibrio axinellae]